MADRDEKGRFIEGHASAQYEIALPNPNYPGKDINGRYMSASFGHSKEVAEVRQYLLQKLTPEKLDEVIDELYKLMHDKDARIRMQAISLFMSHFMPKNQTVEVKKSVANVMMTKEQMDEYLKQANLT